MPDYRRNFVPGGSFFFTVNLLERKHNDLLIRHIDEFRHAVRVVRKAHPFMIDAWVILPDHMHCVWTLPPGDADYVTRWRLIKAGFSRRIPGTERRSAVRQRRGERGIWQRRYWEHTLTDEKDYAAHVEYVHINPLKHRLVRSVADWPYSTFLRYVKAGVCSADWAGNGLAQGLAYED